MARTWPASPAGSDAPRYAPHDAKQSQKKQRHHDRHRGRQEHRPEHTRQQTQRREEYSPVPGKGNRCEVSRRSTSSLSGVSARSATIADMHPVRNSLLITRSDRREGATTHKTVVTSPGSEGKGKRSRYAISWATPRYGSSRAERTTASLPHAFRHNATRIHRGPMAGVIRV